MKTPTKPAFIIFIFIVLITGAKASPFLLTDTSKNETFAITSNAAAISNKANVVYPPILSGHESQTMEYIERFSINKRAYVLHTFSKGKKYFPKITAIFNKYELPHEFKVLIALESGFNGNARSRAGAVGYWQIMAPVARQYGLKIIEKRTKAKKNTRRTRRIIVIDERKNFDKSTYAAARYLRDRCKDLNNDCLLIVASYNWGIGNVWNAMQRTGKTAPTFWDIKKYMPAETRAYVMNFIALNVIFHNYEKFEKNKLTFQEEETEEFSCEEEDECALMGPVPHIETQF